MASKRAKVVVSLLLLTSQLAMRARAFPRAQPPDKQRPPRTAGYGDPLPCGAIARIGFQAAGLQVSKVELDANTAVSLGA